MRILMVTNTYAPARNGVASWADLSVRELRTRGHDVQVLTYTHPLRPRGATGMVEVRSWFGLDSDFAAAPILFGLPDRIERGVWDVVHVHHPILLGPEGVRVARRAGSKVVFTCHSVYTDYVEQYYWGLARPLIGPTEQMVRRFADRCDIVLAPSSRVVRWLGEIGASAPVELFEIPADTTRIAPIPRHAARAALGLGDARIALYVGRIADEKRVEELVDEFDAGCRELQGTLLVLAGTGVRFSNVLRHVRRLGLEDRVRLLGPLGGQDLGLWYSAADLFVSASRSEGGPVALVEAMACGCPSVSLRAPGFVDRVADGVNGLLVEDRDGALGEAMARVLADPGLQDRLRAGCLERAVRYSPEANTDRLEQLYGSVLG